MFKEKLSIVPTSPGCYLMKDDTGLIIYVGKAKNLRNRLKSYFTGDKYGKTKALVSNINTFEYIVTVTETEALLLENNLIKKYTPKYNILLKDDKTYPYIEVTNEKYPRVRVVRRANIIKKSKSHLFGPYPNSYAARKIVELINRIFKIRKCSVLPDKVCLYYHIDQCPGYCVYKIPEEEIVAVKKEVISFLKGNTKEVVEKVNNDILKASESLNFEKASELKICLDFITDKEEKQKMDLKMNESFDVFNYYEVNGYMSVQTLFIRNGKLIGREAEIVHLIEEAEEEIISYISNFYQSKKIIIPQMILVPSLDGTNMLEEILDTKIVTPIRGTKSKLIKMAFDNAQIYLNEKIELIKRDEDRTINSIEELEKLLNIKSLKRIESFDNSNLFGTFAVSGMVVFIDGNPVKNEYRKYKITTVDKPDDYNTMREVIYRRYFRVLKDNLTKPDLLIVDGGIGQINIAKEVIASLGMNIPVYGLKKDDKHNTNSLIGGKDNEIIEIPKRSNVFYLLERIQNEVHNYAISYHKQIRSKGALTSILENVPGLGEKRRKTLLKKFKSLKKMEEASLEELTEYIPEKVALELKKHLKSR